MYGLGKWFKKKTSLEEGGTESLPCFSRALRVFCSRTLCKRQFSLRFVDTLGKVCFHIGFVGIAYTGLQKVVREFICRSWDRENAGTGGPSGWICDGD